MCPFRELPLHLNMTISVVSLAFLFSELSNRGLITPNWQSVIAKNKLFVTKNIKKDKYLNQGDLATAANYVKGVEHEKDYVTISNYIKQLKKL